jgi:thioredoxin-like negative regulator of GroEL
MAGLVGCKHDASSLTTPASAGVRSSLVFVENDYARALADARARNIPLFVDAWAPWCHTCLSMRSYVFPDPSLSRYARRFVWLSLDTERKENAGIASRLGVAVLPTLYAIDPIADTPLAVWRGSLTASELAAFLDDAEIAATHFEQAESATVSLLRAEQSSAAGQHEDAIAAYRAALASGPSDWPRRARAIDGWVTELAESHQAAACVRVARTEAPTMAAGSAVADVLRAAIACAAELPPEAPERALRKEVVELGERVAADASQPILADDRSDLYGYVVDGFRNLGDDADAKRVARNWASMLQDEARRAPSPAARAVFDAHRLLAYIAIGEPERAIAMLELSEHDFPEDYNPPARLAAAYLAMKRYDAALSAITRALSLAYGPRKLRLWSLEADLFEAKGDRPASKRSLREALDFANRVPLTGSYPTLRDAIAQRLAAMP